MTWEQVIYYQHVTCDIDTSRAPGNQPKQGYATSHKNELDKLYYDYVGCSRILRVTPIMILPGATN